MLCVVCDKVTMKSVKSIIDALGGNGRVASWLGLSPSAASEFKRRNSIPVKYWPRLIELASASNVELDNDTLVEVHAGEPA